MTKRSINLQEHMKKENINGALLFKKENRRYFCGFTGTTGYTIITKDRLIFATDFRYTEEAREKCSGFEIIEIDNNYTVFDLLKELSIKSLAIEESFINHKLIEELRELAKIEKFCYLDEVIKEIRAVKDIEEIKMIKRACEITDEAFDDILGFIKVGVTEREINIRLQNFMKAYIGVESTADSFIIASGKRSSLPHGIATDKKIEDGDFVMMDFGCTYKGYWSDMTRTVCVGKACDKQREIYSVVLEAQELATKAIKAGLKGKDIDKIARDYIASKGYGREFGHGLGHGIGLEIHEAPRFAQTKEAEIILKAGMIGTIEPGVYIEGFGGVRIEDDVLVTENGYEVLCKSPKHLIEL